MFKNRDLQNGDHVFCTQFISSLANELFVPLRFVWKTGMGAAAHSPGL